VATSRPRPAEFRIAWDRRRDVASSCPDCEPRMSYFKRLTKSLTQSRFVQKSAGIVAAEYLRLVWNTS
jgi:hypothetical protein